MKIFKKRMGQSATEYLMTYGWAILAIVVVAGVLWNMGLFGGGSCGNSVTGFAGTQVSVKDWALTDTGVLTLNLRNAAGENIELTSVSVDAGAINQGTNDWNLSTAGVVISGTAGPTGTPGACYSYDLGIAYTTKDGVPHTARGKINGAYE
ncbi:MAG: hypothetical protein K0B07_04100 [DPANN group archaeon]|nr:hypothetical protein [DPANN group archaeon]